MGSSRRKFLRESLATVSAAIASRALTPSFTYAQGAPSNIKNVVELFLAGGPDSRYVFPYLSGPVDAVLRTRRPNISMDPLTFVTPTGFQQNGRANPIALHANFSNLVGRVNTANAGLSIISEFGATSNASRSHEVAQQMYRDATLAGSASVPGWIGRVASEFGLPSLAVWGLSPGDNKLLAVDTAEKPYIVSRLSDLAFTNRNFGSFNCQNMQMGGAPLDCASLTAELRTSSATEDTVYMRDVLRRLQDQSLQTTPVHSLMAAAQESTFQAVPHASRMISEVTIDINQFRFNAADDSVANSFADIARAIHYLNLSPNAPANAKAATKFFATMRGGWDSHSAQANGIPTTIGRIGAAIGGLVYYLDQWGLLDQTIILTYGEFGRTNAQNGSAGTDHAESGHMLVVGGGSLVGRGVFGPDASASQAQNENFFTAQVPQTGILRAVLGKVYSDSEALDRVFISPMPGSVPSGWLL